MFFFPDTNVAGGSRMIRVTGQLIPHRQGHLHTPPLLFQQQQQQQQQPNPQQPDAPLTFQTFQAFQTFPNFRHGPGVKEGEDGVLLWKRMSKFICRKHCRWN